MKSIFSLSNPNQEPQRRDFFKWAGASIAALLLPGCASTPPSSYRINNQPFHHMATHIMAQGETVWRISKMYDVSVDEIVQLNHIGDVRDISIGTVLAIPSSLPPMPSYQFDKVPLYPNFTKWKYIIIHHTASDIGDAGSIDQYHRSRGYHSLGYHFLVGNGSKNKQRVGLIEPGPRWYHQQDGAHCKADNMNMKAIGLSIVGNYSKTYVLEEQISSLAFLTKKLMNYYSIPKSRVLPHRGVSGASTECPGNLFPWARFMGMI